MARLVLVLSAITLSTALAAKLGFQQPPVPRWGAAAAPVSRRRAATGVRALQANAEGTIEKLRFLTPELVSKVAETYGTPTYVYDAATLKDSAEKTLSFPNAYGLTVRYAMKASPNAAILKLFSDMGLCIDASSGYEIQRAMRAGVKPPSISLSSQELPPNFDEYVKQGVTINACSLAQIDRFGARFPGGEIGLRFNPGLGSGGTGKTNVGGPSSSFGIWHELLNDVKAIVAKHNLKVFRIHTHIGSGSDPEVWQRVATLSLDLVRQFPDVKVLNLGGGYKVGRMSYEKTTDLIKIGEPVKEKFVAFAKETGRELKLEIEPGTFLVANAGALVTTVQDKTTTSAHTFLKLDAGMTEVLRPSLYGAQHPLIIVPKDQARAGQHESYVVVGHCCESGDLLTPAAGDAETITERVLNKAEIGDYCVIEGSGAYCAGMSTKNYNSFPEAAEAMLGLNGKDVRVIRKRQTLDQVLSNEVALE